MKQLIILILTTVNCGFLQAQWLCSEYTLTLEDTICINLRIDTSKQTNSWQIGSPQKNIFTSAHSPHRVIVTDTLNSYSANDTSSFIIMNIAGPGFTYPFIVGLAGYYQVDTDSLNDYGLLEFSPNNGVTWIDLLNDTVYSAYYDWGLSDKPVFTGKTSGWTRFHVRLGSLGPVFNIQDGDTVLYRFTFISDSIPDGLDGLMFDDFDYVDFVMGIEYLDFEEINSKAFPNPAFQNLTIEFSNSNHSDFTLVILDNLGRVVYRQDEIRTGKHELFVRGFQSGLYHYSLIGLTEKKQSLGSFVIEK